MSQIFGELARLPRAVLGGRWAAQVSSDPSLYAVVMSRRRQSRDDAG
jgi:hypothetical protein